LRGKLKALGTISVDQLNDFFESLRPIWRFCVETFRDPIKSFGAHGWVNAAHAVWSTLNDMQLALTMAEDDPALASATVAGVGKLAERAARSDRHTDSNKIQLNDALISPGMAAGFVEWMTVENDREEAKPALAHRIDNLVAGCDSRVHRSARDSVGACHRPSSSSR
jgi:hypothetical protein